MFCALFTLSSNTTLGKNAIFQRFWFPQVMQKHTMGKMKNYITIWWPVVSEILLPKIIRIR